MRVQNVMKYNFKMNGQQCWLNTISEKLASHLLVIWSSDAPTL